MKKIYNENETIILLILSSNLKLVVEFRDKKKNTKNNIFIYLERAMKLDGLTMNINGHNLDKLIVLIEFSGGM